MLILKRLFNQNTGGPFLNAYVGYVTLWSQVYSTYIHHHNHEIGLTF